MNCRKPEKGITDVSPTENENHTKCNNTPPFFVFNRKQLNSILGGPYKDSMRMHCQSEPARVTATCKNLLGQRIISAKVLRVKELQNQLTDAHYHLNELANENRLLKALQKRQDSALKRYEGTNAELPRIINSHQEELKVLQTKYKQLKFQHKQTCDLLKEKESEIHSLQNQNKHLLKLSKDQQLGEREKLQIQVSDLNHEIEEQHKTIQMLNRKLTLQNKKFKHQINTEVTKHRDTRRQLHISLEKLKKLEELLNNREKRLYSNPHSHQLPSFDRKKATTSQSLTNLRNNSLPTTFAKSSNNVQYFNEDMRNEILPKLNMREPNDIGKLSTIRTSNAPDIANTSETMTSLNNVRKFRLQKSSQSRHSSPYASDENETRDKLEVETSPAIDDSKMNFFCTPINIQNLRDDGVVTHESAQEDLDDIIRFGRTTPIDTYQNYRPPEKIMRKFRLIPSNSDLSDVESHTNEETTSPTCNSKYLHSRLVNTAVNGISTKEEKLHLTTSKKSEALNESGIEEEQESSSPYDNSEKNDIRLRDRMNVNVHENSSLEEFPHLSRDETSEHYPRTKRSDNSDIKSNRSSVRRNSMNNPCNKFDCNNRDNFTSGTDLRTPLRGQLDTVRDNFSASLQLKVDSPDVLTMKNNFSDNTQSESKNSDMSDELLQYFDIEINADELRKLSISESHNRYSVKPTINGLSSNLENNVDVIDENSTNSSDDLAKDCNYQAKGSNSNEEEKGEYLTLKYNEHISTAKQSNTVRTRELTLKQQSGKQEPSALDSKAINFNKQKLLAAMKAIDENEGTEFTQDKKMRETNNSIRSQVTENLYRGLPTHTRKRDDIIKDIFADTKIDVKLQSGCSKLH